ncbi:hypothetical protein SKAU_G00377650 [Synaphobranchus kaupii]|uniref:Uncharacterized protein n=1 Tax=Synaphobranchus kaupii TaxID=118154 RepID=A0A9Q1ED06_SYNKA|nr:hypothetical protein SKAU_G00377650 [Synaphobranchus kaupii]
MAQNNTVEITNIMKNPVTVKYGLTVTGLTKELENNTYVTSTEAMTVDVSGKTFQLDSSNSLVITETGSFVVNNAGNIDPT